MEQMNLDNEKIEQLRNYYANDGLLIIGLNNPQEIRTTSTILKKGLLEYLSFALKRGELSPTVINSFSAVMDKTEHIDYFLINNLSVEEIKLSQVYSAISALENVMIKLGLPKFLGQIGYLSRFLYIPRKGDEKVKITTSLKEAKEPVLIYSSGLSDLAREVGANPFMNNRFSKDMYTKTNYYYVLEKARNPYTLQKVIGSIERNFNGILGINGQTDIYTLGTLLPKSLHSEEMNIFRDLIIAYNDALKTLCNQYGVTFIDVEELEHSCRINLVDFDLTSVLANTIIRCMYENKIVSPAKKECQLEIPYEITNFGSKGIINCTSADYEKSINSSSNLSGYRAERELEIAEDHKREARIFQKVLMRKTD